MATLVSEQVAWIAHKWEKECGYPSAVLSGIVPDARHLESGGYHCSVEDLRRFGNASDYSNTRPDDRDRNPKYGAAIDMSMSPADMKRCHDRMRRVWANIADPRRKYLNAFNTWDGSGDAVRLDFYAGTAKYATPDHKWHDHGEIRRRYVLDWAAARAIVSALKGETAAQFAANEGDDMSAQAESEIHQVYAGMFHGGSSMGRAVDPDGTGAAKPGNSLVAKFDYALARLDALFSATVEEKARDAGTAKLLTQVLAAAGNPLTPEQFAQVLDALRTAAKEAGAEATKQLGAQLAAAAQAQADALAGQPSES